MTTCLFHSLASCHAMPRLPCHGLHACYSSIQHRTGYTRNQMLQCYVKLSSSLCNVVIRRARSKARNQTESTGTMPELLSSRRLLPCREKIFIVERRVRGSTMDYGVGVPDWPEISGYSDSSRVPSR
ncbi:hypothetical protein BJX62DRAFT_80284 [Aspergillus germanicus]